MPTTKHIATVIIFLYCSVLLSCKKYLSEKQDQKLVVPGSVQDLQSLLDKWSIINQNYPEAGDFSSDDYYFSYPHWEEQEEYIRRTYTWEKDHLFEPGRNNGWAFCYSNIYIANTVLFNINRINIPADNLDEWNNTKGSAHFLRGMCFVQIAWIWCLAYDETSAATDLGIPLRLDPNFNTASVRSSLKQTYDQIIADLKAAADLLPENPVHVIRPSKAAAHGWLARTYLSMRNYDSALVYCSKYLDQHPGLMDFNSLDTTSTDPIPSFNTEVIYHCLLNTPVSASRIRIDSNLYNSYHPEDMRKVVFFRSNGDGTFRFKGSYDGSNYGGNAFNGIVTDEMYLTRAECNARKGNTIAALQDLNTIMVKRWKNNGSWLPFTAGSSGEALSIILQERRKELIQRGLRWPDIKRLNKEGSGIILKRELNGKIYVLNPNDARYALPIPEDVISETGMPQNPR